MNQSITIPEAKGLMYLKTQNAALKIELEEIRRYSVEGICVDFHRDVRIY